MEVLITYPYSKTLNQNPMKKKKILSVFVLILFAIFMVQCEKYGNRPDRAGEGDDDSDRPEWAGGGDGVNPHQNPNPSPGISKGGDYGDLYVLLRDVNGLPEMTQIPVEDEMIWVVQPIDSEGEVIPYNDEGELSDPTLALPVDFGRLNIVRSPPSVLEQAFNEAMKVLTGEGVPGREVIGITLDFCGRLTSEYSDDGGVTSIFKTIDSPRENMAIYKEIMQNLDEGRMAFLEIDYDFDLLTIAASCFAAGSDKTGTVDVDEMIYINTFMECVGLVPLVNENEYGPDGLEREYFNFYDYGFEYDRSVYANRYIQCLLDENGIYCPVDEETGISAGPVYSILDIFNGIDTPIVGGSEFTYRQAELMAAEAAGLFAIAIDDAVQVLDYVHGNSNFRFVADAAGNPL